LLSDGAHALAGMGMYRMALWFGGRPVPCAGVSLVGVAAQHRRQGAARTMLFENLRELHREGEPIAALYPSTQALYRSVGYEQAGSRSVFELTLASIGLHERDLPVHAVALDSPAPFLMAARRRAERTNGNIERPHAMWERLLSTPDEKPHSAFVFGSLDDPEGFVVYYQQPGVTEPSAMVVRDMAANTPAAARRLWSFLADHASICSAVSWAGPANDPLLAVPAECKWTPAKVLRWMLRIVRVDDALRLRGYRHGSSEGELHLEVTDELLPENTGKWLLRVDSGAAQVERGGRGELKCNIRALAALYSSMFSASTLIGLGWIEASPDALRTADALFAGPEPWMAEIF
jgi:predicted acetyltransferase